MNRMTVAAMALTLASCANFDQLEADALDAGRIAGMSGGSAGGTSGGSAGGMGGGSAGGSGGGSAGGMSGGSAAGMGGGSAGGTSGGSAGGTSGGSAAGMGGGSAGGTSGGSAGGTSGGSAGGLGGGSGAGMSGGSAGGTSGGVGAGSAGGTSGGSSGGMSGGSAGGFGRPEPWGGTHPVVSPDLLLAVAASSSNGQLATVTSADGGVFVDTINAARFFAPGTLADLDARFGSVVLTTSNGVWLLNSALQWWPVTGSPSSPAVGLSTPIFRPPSGAEQLASYWRTSPSTVSLYSTPPFSTDGGIPPGLSMSTTVLPNPMTFRVRPDSSGQSGVIAGSFSLDGGCEPGSQAVFGRISSQNASVEGGSVPACDMMVASSEAQTALLVWRARDMMGRIHAAFWQPGGLNGLPTEPDHWLSSSFGILPVDAIATDGVRHAAIVYQPANSVLTSGDAGVETGASGYVLIVLRSSSPPRFIDLGPRAVPPFSLAFGVSGAQGVFVLANCSISGGGGVGICATPGAVVGFLAQP